MKACSILEKILIINEKIVVPSGRSTKNRSIISHYINYEHISKVVVQENIQGCLIIEFMVSGMRYIDIHFTLKKGEKALGNK